MKSIYKILFGMAIIVVVSVALWSSLDEYTRCNLSYSRNICNFYAVVNMEVTNPTSDFNKMMNLCKDMDDVPKKDSCFHMIAWTFRSIDMNKAKEACNGIKSIKDEPGNIVYTRDECYKMIQEQK